MDDKKVDNILANVKFSMEVEGFTITPELEEVGRKIVTGELDVNEYVASYISTYKKKAAGAV